MNFAELAFTVPDASAEPLAAALWEAGVAGLQELDAGTLGGPVHGLVTLVVWVAPDAAEALLDRLGRREPELLALARLERRDRQEDEWRDAWKRYFKVERIGRFVIVPSWERHRPAPGELILDLDPGRAFGTGRHASTSLCLEVIGRLSLRPAVGVPQTGWPRRVLDVGCGSGILAIAAARAWPAIEGTGLDIDPAAIEVSRENAERNRVDRQLRFEVRPVESLGELQDLVLANIQPEVLIPMAPELGRLLAPGGRMVLSGIVTEAAPAVLSAYRDQGLDLDPIEHGGAETSTSRDGWQVLVLGRTGDGTGREGS